MTLEELKARFEDPASFRWIPLGALRAGEFLSCIDGRHDEYVIAGPGGDLGEVVLLLAAIEAHVGRPLGDRQVFECVRALMDWHPRFFMHTDIAAITALEEALERDERFVSAFDSLTVARIEALLQRPPLALQGPLSEYLVRPEYTGCGHLRALLDAPAEYGVRLELARAVVRSFFRRMWDGSPSAQFAILEGVHEERAVLVIEVDGAPTAGLFVPAVLQSGREMRVFVQHTPAREYLRRSFLDVLEHHGHVEDQPDDVIMQICADLAERQLESTLRRLGESLPRFTVHFGESHVPTCIPRAST